MKQAMIREVVVTIHYDSATISAADAPGTLRPNRRLTALARALAASARDLLPMPNGMILGVVRNARELRLLWWDHGFALAAEVAVPLDDFCPEGTSEGAVQRDGEALIAYLAGRWPLHAAPSELGVITDGEGVAFAPTRPSPAAPGWLLHHACGETPLQAILPLDPAGPCRVLNRPVASQSVH